jgi:hypothetical protein
VPLLPDADRDPPPDTGAAYQHAGAADRDPPPDAVRQGAIETMTIGNITQDDLYQIIAIILCASSIVVWLVVMRRSKYPLFFLVPIIASGTTLCFYMLVAFVPMSIADATTLSAARTVIDQAMWLICGGVMIYMQRQRARP